MDKKQPDDVDNIKLILEISPLIAFFVTLKLANFFWATAVIMILTPIAVGYEFYKTKKLSIPPLITLILVMGFGLITLLTKDSGFFQLKTTLLYLLFAAILAIGLCFKKNFIKMLMEKQIQMPEENWYKFTIRFIMLFIAFAAANEVVRRFFSEDFWAGFKIVIVVISMVFMMSQIYLLSPDFREMMKEKQKKQEKQD